MATQGTLRLQVFLSHSGACSRRKALVLIQDGAVSVNGSVVREPSFIIDPSSDSVVFGDRAVKLSQKIYIKLNKPSGVVTTRSDAHAASIVTDLLPKKFRQLHPVGRLDKQTEGLLLLTNDGELTYRLTHPKFGIKKIYRGRLAGEFLPAQAKRLESGIVLRGVRTAACTIKILSFLDRFTDVEIALIEGRKRQIREMFAAAGNPVIHLIRIKEGSLELGDLAKGAWRLLSQQEVENLYKDVGFAFERRPSSTSKRTGI